MYPKLRLINGNDINAVTKRIRCGEYERVYLSSADFEAPYSETEPIGEWKAPKDFPNCCNFHRSAFAETVSLIERFPNCCELHKKLVKANWFNKEDYKGVPMKLLNTLSHTEYHILNRIDAPEWYADITNYIDYCIASFGQLPDDYGAPVGLSIYLANLKRSIKISKDIPKEKKTKLNQYIDSRLKGGKKEEETDINVLLTVYSRWLKTFPFELSIFKHLKEKFHKTIPVLKGQVVENPYLGYAKAQLKTQKELVSFLISTTEKILSEINTVALYEKGQLADVNKLSIELLIQGRKLELKEIGERDVDERKQYRDILKQWFAGEERFLEKLKPLLLSEASQPPQQMPTKAEKLKAELGKYGFYELPIVKRLSNESQDRLIDIIATNKLPYQIAMFDYLGFIENLNKNHFSSKYKVNKEIAKWLGSDKDGRAVKANISSLSKNTGEDKSRYTAHLHKETVKTDYQSLK